MNLLKMNFRPTYYLRHPFRFFEEWGSKIRHIWARVTKGYSWYDSADMDTFLLHIIPGMLRDIAEGESYPCIEPFENSPEAWEDYCNSLADVFESLQEENWYGQNEWAEEFDKACDVRHHIELAEKYGMTIEEAEEICKLYFERENELATQWQNQLEDAFKNLVKYFSCFWI